MSSEQTEQFTADTPLDLSRCARAILARIVSSSERATIITLRGELGAGKTALTKAIAAELGVVREVASPTFVLMKRYDIPPGNVGDQGWGALVHIDLYRIEDDSELRPLGWDALLALPRTIVAIEWPERAPGAIPTPDATITVSALPGDARSIVVEYKESA
jgi:tRNA threonylcarbamoyl adenosine modification protein YjeE